MASPAKPWKSEYAKSARSSCKTCKNTIDKERLRLGKMVQSSTFDGLIPMWHHVDCVLKKAKQIKSADDVEGLESLRWEDQQKIRKYLEGGGSDAGGGGGGGSGSTPSKKANVEYGVEVSQTSRATCRKCSNKIVKGEVRISSKPDGQGARGLAWHHAKCLIESLPSIMVEKLVGWETLPATDQASVRALVKTVPSSVETESTAKVGAKRRKESTDDHNSKVAKTGEDASGAAKNHGDSDSCKLEAQTKALWDLKDNLKKHVTTAELREMLEANDQDSSGSELDLRDRCADGMMFGVLGRCPICSGLLQYSGGVYRCQGFLSEWSKCSFSTREPERLKEKWKVPEETKNDYLIKWFKSQKIKKPLRILSPSCESLGLQTTVGPVESSKVKDLSELRVAFVGLPGESMNEWRSKVEGAGGQIHPKAKKGTNCLVVSGVLDHENTEVKKARRMKIPIVRDDYLVQCFKKQKKLPFDHYKVEAIGGTSGVVTVKVKGSSAVHEASGLQETGHILEDKKSIYNTTLNMSDLSTGVNSYYILQIIEADKGTECYVFRKWGRVGNEKIGGFKLDEFPKTDAICEFRRLFLEKTGNSWDDWEEKKNFQKKPGKFFPLDIDYGITKQVSKSKMNSDASRLPPPVVELMMMLFNVETYRAAMREFEINMSEMPLGKLSKSNIQKGFQALTDIQALLTSSMENPAVRESLIVDASNRFFTVIPSVHPHVIRDEDDFKSKVKMLEALQDIEIAARLVGFDADRNDSLDEKYSKLNCEIAPLPHDCEDFQLIEKYLQNTHAPTHTEWSLQLEDVFYLEREGESDKFLSLREKLRNKMLLWHGSRLTNFVGILSQGLRIAPPEAPATGYMFGKGVYFADLVSKSAQYCYTDKKSPVGLMLLSEVALGEVYELKKATYMEKPPKGKHSTKGLGKKVPQESEFVKWRNDVTVPCGKPVSSNVRATELMYNEYIVYDTSQIKMQFLLKVRFHHKR